MRVGRASDAAKLTEAENADNDSAGDDKLTEKAVGDDTTDAALENEEAEVAADSMQATVATDGSEGDDKLAASVERVQMPKWPDSAKKTPRGKAGNKAKTS